MIGAVMLGKGDAGVQAVDGGRRGVEKVAGADVPARLEDRQEAGEVRADIGLGLIERIAHAGLGGEMHDGRPGLKAAIASRNAGASVRSRRRNSNGGGLPQTFEPRLLQGEIVIAVDVVDAETDGAVRRRDDARGGSR